jgi:hypothetical protein
MSIQQTQTNSFKKELLEGVHNFLVDTFKISLYTASATIGAETTVYTTEYEVVGSGYTAGGEALTDATVQLSGGTAYVDFANATWSPANFTARGALIYNASKGNKAVAVLDFGADKTTSTNFVVQMPSNTASSALIRFS